MNPSLEELACLYVLDQLDPSERAEFATRLAREPQLGARVRELEDALACRINTLPPHIPSAGLLARIEASIDRLPANGESTRVRNAAPRWGRMARWGLAAAVAVGAVGAGMLAIRSLRPAGPAAPPFLIVAGLDPGRSTLAELPVSRRPVSADASFINLATLAEEFWQKPEDLPAALSPAGRVGRGYALFDPGSNQGFIAIRQLPAIGEDRRYHLWVVDTASGQAREAGILPMAGSSRGLYFFSVAPAAGAKPERLDFFVTAEDAAAPEPTQPHGQVVLGAKPI